MAPTKAQGGGRGRGRGGGRGRGRGGGRGRGRGGGRGRGPVRPVRGRGRGQEEEEEEEESSRQNAIISWTKVGPNGEYMTDSEQSD